MHSYVDIQDAMDSETNIELKTIMEKNQREKVKLCKG